MADPIIFDTAAVWLDFPVSDPNFRVERQLAIFPNHALPRVDRVFRNEHESDLKIRVTQHNTQEDPSDPLCTDPGRAVT